MNTERNPSIEQRTARIMVVVLAAALLVWLSYQLRIVIIDALLAVIIAAAIAPVAERGEQHKIPRALTVLLVYVGVALFYTGVGFALAKPLREQADLFKQHIPQYRQQVGDAYETVRDRTDDFANKFLGIDMFDNAPSPLSAPALATPSTTQPHNADSGDVDAPAATSPTRTTVIKSETITTKTPAGKPADKPRKVEPGQIQDVATKIARETLAITAGLFGALLNAVLVLFLAGYFVVAAREIWSALLQWVPPPNRPRAEGLIAPLGYRMGGYVRGQLLVSTAVAAVFGVGFTVINLQYSFVLAILAGLFNLVPFVGSMIVTLLAILIAANTGGPVLVGLTIGVFAIEQFLESNFIVPHLLGKQVDLHPLLVLIAILVGGTLAGALGAIVAVPVASALLFLGQEFYVKPINDIPTDVVETATIIEASTLTEDITIEDVSPAAGSEDWTAGGSLASAISGGTTEEITRAAIFQVIVMQAMGNTPWRQTMKGPMSAHNITAEEIEAEVRRRKTASS